jgi:PAS domain S-box-containing protein
VKRVIRILHLEDNVTDAEFVQALLDAKAVTCEMVRVESREAFAAALDQGGFDLIVSEFAFPSYDGRSALALARLKRPDVPFVFFSGTIGEDAAIEALQAGATDYVLKERPARLATALIRALRETHDPAERQLMGSALQSTQERFKEIYESSKDAIVYGALEARHEDVNESMIKLGAVIRILHLEDDAQDAELVHGLLSAEGLVCDMRRVDTRADFVDGLDQHLFDLILSDYTIPGFDGLSALSLAQDTCPEVPFIFVSGTLGEESAVVTMQCGATDYVLKNHMSRLVPAVRRALRESDKRMRLKQAEEAMRKSEERFRLLARATNDAVRDWDLVSNAVWWNDGFQALFGYSQDEIEADIESWYRRLHPEDRNRVIEGIHGAIRSGRCTWMDEYRFRRSDDTYSVVMDRGYVVHDQGKPVRLLSSAIDITDRKRVEGELREAKDRAEQADRSKSEFLANMSHEIRTPMNVILGMTDLLWDTELSEQQQEYCRAITRAGRSLLGSITDILDLSEVEGGRVALEHKVFDLGELIDGTVPPFAMQAEEKGLELSCVMSPELPRHVIGDPKPLHKILGNLLGNAVKFTQRGRIVLRIDHDPASQEPGALRFAVCDTGIGIPPEKHALIFEQFTQVDASLSRQHGGNGLGLTISKRLVDLMGGRIWVESVVGQGSTFYFTTRLGLSAESSFLDNQPSYALRSHTIRSDDTPTPSRPLQNLQPLRILLVEDSADNCKLIRAYLKQLPYSVDVAENGEIAVEKFTRYAYDGVLMDIQMPIMDGYAATRAIRQWEQEKGRGAVPILALTAHARPEDAARSLAAGCTGHLTKPITKATLIATISEYVQRAATL